MSDLRLGSPVVLQIPGGVRGQQGIQGIRGEEGPQGPMGDVTPEAQAAAATATGAAGTAAAARDDSVAASGVAQAAATGAGASASQALAASTIVNSYPNSAATTVPPGVALNATYWAASADGLSMRQYQNTAGVPVAVAGVPAQPTKLLLDAVGQVFDSTRLTRNGKWIAGWLARDANGRRRFLSGHRPDGTFQIGNVLDVGGKVATTAATFFSLNKRSGYFWGVRDAMKRRIIAVGTNMHLYVGNVDHSASLTSLNSAIAAVPVSTLVVDAWGDSLTYGVNAATASGAWPAQFAALTGLTVNNFGVPGQNSTGIAMRQGGLPIIVTLTGNAIPASGGVVVTLGNSSAFTGYVGIPIPGRIGSVAGTLVRSADATPVYTFTRTTAGSAVPVPPSSAFIPSAQGHQKDAIVIWAGRNDINNNEPATNVPAAVLGMIARLTAVNKRFVVLSVLNGAGEGTGTAKYTLMQTINAALLAAYPANYIDVRYLLIQANNGSTQDLADVAADIVPTSLRTTAGVTDTQHLNTAGYAVVAAAVANFFTNQGWLS